MDRRAQQGAELGFKKMGLVQAHPDRPPSHCGICLSFDADRPQLSQAELVYTMAAADDATLKVERLFSNEVQLAAAPKQVIVSGEDQLEHVTASADEAD